MDLLTWVLGWKPLGALASAALAIYTANRKARERDSDAPAVSPPPLATRLGRMTRLFRWTGEIGASPVTLRVNRLEAAAKMAKAQATITALQREIALLRSTPTCSNGSSSDSKATIPATTSDEAKTP